MYTNNIYLLIIYVKAQRTDVPPFRTVVHKSLSALAKDSPANLHRTGRPSNRRHICIKQKIALCWVLEGGNIVKGWVANNLCVTVSISNDWLYSCYTSVYYSPIAAMWIIRRQIKVQVKIKNNYALTTINDYIMKLRSHFVEWIIYLIFIRRL